MSTAFVVGGVVVLAVALGVLLGPWAGAGALLALDMVSMSKLAASSRADAATALLGVLQRRRLPRDKRKPRVSRAF